MNPDEQKAMRATIDWLESPHGEIWSCAQHFNRYGDDWISYQGHQLSAYSYRFFSLKEDIECGETTWLCDKAHRPFWQGNGFSRDTIAECYLTPEDVRATRCTAAHP
jgi:hypothetical protein